MKWWQKLSDYSFCYVVAWCLILLSPIWLPIPKTKKNPGGYESKPKGINLLEPTRAGTFRLGKFIECVEPKPDEGLLTINEWLDAIGCDRAYKKDMGTGAGS